MVNRGKLPGNYGASPLLPREQPLLSLVLWDLVFGLQLGQSIDHPGDEALVLVLLYSVGLSLSASVSCERHQSWDGP